jgi:DNA-binding response OmpR family regulator
MATKNINILYIEDNPADFVYLRELLAEEQEGEFSLENADRLTSGLERLAVGGIDLVLLDLSLPDSFGLETFRAVKEATADLPVILMSGMQDERLALLAVDEGAHDYLTKGKVDIAFLSRTIRSVVKREAEAK